jgi:hypothetical protein
MLLLSTGVFSHELAMFHLRLLQVDVVAGLPGVIMSAKRFPVRGWLPPDVPVGLPLPGLF